MHAEAQRQAAACVRDTAAQDSAVEHSVGEQGCLAMLSAQRGAMQTPCQQVYSMLTCVRLCVRSGVFLPPSGSVLICPACVCGVCFLRLAFSRARVCAGSCMPHTTTRSSDPCEVALLPQPFCFSAARHPVTNTPLVAAAAWHCNTTCCTHEGRNTQPETCSRTLNTPDHSQHTLLLQRHSHVHSCFYLIKQAAAPSPFFDATCKEWQHLSHSS
jgi:hypothetical protein